ncbi:MAG: hypothetical protein ABIH26_15400 [Candidatus Eisenbacteria bacterium]
MCFLPRLDRVLLALACAVVLLGGIHLFPGAAVGAAASLSAADSTASDSAEAEVDTAAEEERDRERGVRVKVDIDTEDEVGSLTMDSGDLVRMGQSHTIDSTTMVSGDAVVIGGNLDVYGKIGGDAVVIGGALHLHPGAFVSGEAVVIGGRLTKEEGAFVGGEQVSIGTGFEQFFPWSWCKREVSPWKSAGRTLIGAVVRIVLVFLAILIFVDLFGERTGRIAGRVESDSFRSGLFGLLGVILVPVTILVLVISCIGILLLPVLGVLIGVAFLWGVVAASLVIGRTVGRRFFPDLETPRYQAFVGFLILGATAFVGALLLSWGGPIRFLGWTFAIAGKVILGLAYLVGFGAVLATRFGRRPKGEVIVEEGGAAGAPSPGAGV